MWTRLWLALSILAGTPSVMASSNPVIDAREVRVYLQPGFQGPYKAWTLEPGEHHHSVADLGAPWAGQIVAIQLGSEVGAMLFEQLNFRFGGSRYVNFAASVSDLAVASPGADNRYSSLIVYRRSQGHPLGLLAGNSAASEFRFFPLFQHAGCSYADVRHLMPPPIDFALLYSAPDLGEKMSAVLFDGLGCQGSSVRLEAKSALDSYRLADVGFARPVVSMRLDTKRPVAKLKQVPGGILGRPGVADPRSELLAAPPAAGSCAIAGRATGTHAERASWYRIRLRGPGDGGGDRATIRFEGGRYRFTALAAGRYRVEVTADAGKADLPYPLPPPIPQVQTVDCRGEEVDGIDFRFD